MTFYINQDSELPILMMELIQDGRHDYHKLHECIQNADIYFNMINKDTHVTKIANAKGYIMPKDTQGCTDEYLVCYDWKKRDTREKGHFIGSFTIDFNKDIVSEIDVFPNGKLIMPIYEELDIVIK